jgi:hypothetical protein
MPVERPASADSSNGLMIPICWAVRLARRHVNVRRKPRRLRQGRREGNGPLLFEIKGRPAQYKAGWRPEPRELIWRLRVGDLPEA